MDPSVNESEQRLARLEVQVDSAFAIDARLKALEGDVRKLKSSSLRDWLQALGPYMSGIVVLLIGFWIKDSVTLALQREQLDLEYVKQMRDLVKDFDEAVTAQTAGANANAVGLAMYGKHAIMPLVERLESGDVAKLAAERGLLLVGSNDPKTACPKFLEIFGDKAHRFAWQTQKTMIRVIGQSSCVDAVAALDRYQGELTSLGSDSAKISAFAQRYSEPQGFDPSSVASLLKETQNAIEILRSEAAS